MNMQRRDFLSISGAGAVAASLAGASQGLEFLAGEEGEKIVLAVIGIRGRGMAHIEGFGARNDCELAYLCDVDSQYFTKAQTALEQVGAKPAETVKDMRRVFDDKRVNAVVIATPDHWHAPATVMACQAGKDVYVEKPVSNNIWEGRKMIEAARKYNRVVQSGMQNRSAPYNIAAREYIASGKLGTVELVRVYNQKPQDNFPVSSASPAPTLDWNLWNGPAPEQPYDHTAYSHWHAFWRYGGGEVTNDGVHQLDLARYALGLGVPTAVFTQGRAFREAGASETPDTVITTFDFDGLTMVYEQTLYAPYMIKSDMELRNGDMFPYWPQNGERIEIFGSKAMMILGRHGCGWQVFGRQKNRQPVVIDQMFGRFPDRWHHENFAECVRSRSLPNSDIEEGHHSAMLCHLANISYRVGNQHLYFDPKAERFTNSQAANELLRYSYRAPFGIPDNV